MPNSAGLKVGLTLCKFAPFHNGHHYLLDSALKLVDRLIVVVYDCPDRIDVPLNVRCQWVRTLYPQLEVIEGWDAPNQHEDTDEVKRMQEQYIYKLLKGRKITHFISSEYYGEHMSAFLKAENVVIDMDRTKINISSTMIRSNPYIYRHFVPPIVLKDIITKIAVLGPPNLNTAKIVSQCAREFETVSVEDNTISYLNKESAPMLDFEKIAQERESDRIWGNIIYGANKALFFNSTLLMDYVLSMAINREYLPIIYQKAIKEMMDFELVFVDSDVDSMVSQKYGIQNIFIRNQLIGNLKAMKIDFILLEGNPEDKVRQIIQATNDIINSKKFS